MVHTRSHHASRVIGNLALASVVTTSACSHSTTAPQTGSVSGLVSSSLGGPITGVTVVVTPRHGAALPAVTTNATGSYEVGNVPVGTGSVTLSSVSGSCTKPTPVAYTLTAIRGSATANIDVTCRNPTGTIAGTVSTSPGGVGIAKVAVTITPSGASALPAVMTSSSGAYAISGIPLSAGSGSIALSNVPTGCTLPSATPYTGLTGTAPLVVNIGVTCPTNVTSLAVGQAAVFTGSPAFETTLSLAPNGTYLLAIVNTDSASAALEDFQLVGKPIGASGSGALPPETSRTTARAPLSRPQLARPGRTGPVKSIVPTRFREEMAFMQKAERSHIALLEQNRLILEHYPNPLVQLRREAAARRAQQPPSELAPSSLVATKVGDVNKVYVRTALQGFCSQVDSIGARTVFVGTHVQVLADTSLANWPAQFRFDSSYYQQFGVEYDTLTYAKHLLTYIGDPLQLDQDLSSVGKITVLFTPVVNTFAGGIISFTSPCDFYPRSVNPFSNLTEMIYMSVPSAGRFDVTDWEGFARSTAAHESKHLVSFGDHIIGGTYEPEYVWLEEALAQISSEIWGRNYNLAKWRSDAGFDQTIGCEPTWTDPISCQTGNSPFTFTFSHFPFFYTFLQKIDSAGLSPQESLSGTPEGYYGGGWNFSRWAIDNYAQGSSPADEGGFIKSMITNTNFRGLANVSNVTGAPVADMLVYWSLATALDSTTLADSASFVAQDPRITVPSFDLRNIYAVLFTQSDFYSLPEPVRPFFIPPRAFRDHVTGIPGTGRTYWLLPNGPTAVDLQLQLLSGTGGPISQSSGFRVGMVRVQ